MPNRQKDKTIEEQRYMKNGVEVGRKQIEKKQKDVVDSDGNLRTVEKQKIRESGDTSEPAKSVGQQIKDAANSAVEGIKEALGGHSEPKQENVTIKQTTIKK